MINAGPAPNTTVTGVLFVYNGEGTTGALLNSTPVTINQTTGARFIPLTLSVPVEVTMGQVVTWYLQITSGTTAYQFSAANPYAGGSIYRGTTADPRATTGTPAQDIQFGASFGPTPNPAVTVQSAQVFNPTSAELDGAGYRLLSSPVSGVSITTLADQNLVQGYAAGSNALGNPAQYPAVQSNLFIAYTGAGFLGGANVNGTDFTPRLGTGYFWYLYDRNIAPPPTTSGGGTSTSRELTGFRVTATGSPASADVATAYYLRSSNGAYMLGNPFAQPFQLSGLTKTAGDGALGTVFSAFDPSVGVSGSYVTLAPAAFVAPWQGFFANVTGSTATTAPTFQYAFASASTTATPPFYGRTEALAGGIAFRLDGVTAAGTVGDRATEVRFVEDALVGLDRHDGAKLLPPGDVYALLAPVAQDGAEAYRLSVNSLPEATQSASVPMAFITTHDGTFTLTWDNTLAEARTVSLRDLATGDVVDLATASEYPFTAEAGDWTDRFELVLASRGATASEAGAEAIALGNPTPNPASARSTMTLRVDAAQTVRATIIDALGREVAVVFEGAVAPGTDAVLTLDTARLAPGAYVVRVQGETFAQSRRVTVAR